MLQIKRKHHLQLPHLPTVSPQMQLSAVPVEDDELASAINNDVAEHDDRWELNERPEMGELTEFWDSVLSDVSNDPEWFKFSED